MIVGLGCCNAVRVHLGWKEIPVYLKVYSDSARGSTLNMVNVNIFVYCTHPQI
jgi:hypothetical protein